MTLIFRIFLLSTIAVSPAVAAVRCDPPMVPTTAFGKFLPDGKQLNSGEDHDVSDSSARYLRLRLELLDGAPPDWTVYISDMDGRPLQSFDSRTNRSRGFWTNRFEKSAVKVSVVSNTHAPRPFISVPSFVAMPADAVATYYSIKRTGNADWQPIYPVSGNVPAYQRVHAPSVGMLISTYKAAGIVGWTCSGFLVRKNAASYFVTADHCGAPPNVPDLKWHESVRASMFVDFSWDGDKISRDYIISGKPLFEGGQHDVAILPIEPLGNDAPPPGLKLRESMSPLPDELLTIHHPLSKEKHVSVCSADAVVNRSGVSTLIHQCDVEGGSSGAPLIDKDGGVWGVHVEGHEKKADGTCDRVNKATSAPEVLLLLNRAIDAR